MAQTVFVDEETNTPQHRKVFHPDHEWDSDGKRLPQNRRERGMYLQGDTRFRQPVNRKERREWNRMWKLRGRGITR